MEMRTKSLNNKFEKTKKDTAIPITDLEIERLYSQNSGYAEIREIVLASYRTRVKIKDQTTQIQLKYNLDQTTIYNSALEKLDKLTNFWKLAMNNNNLKVVITIGDCCYRVGKAVCVGCITGEEKSLE